MPTDATDREPTKASGIKRRRKVASCNPCRARRARCDRGRPCAACLNRNDAAGCVWDADALAPLFERREANETERLRGEVDRLQRLVDVLVSAGAGSRAGAAVLPDPPLPQAIPPFFPLPYAAAAVPPPPPLPYPSSTLSSDSSLPTISSAATVSALPSGHSNEIPEPPFDADEDLAQKLSELTMKTFSLTLGDEKKLSEHELVRAAEQLLDYNAPTPSAAFSSTSAASGPIYLAPSTRSLTVDELIAHVPSKGVLDKAVEGYFAAITWIFHVITRDQYKKHQDLVLAAKSKDEPAPPISLAIVFSVAALGLFTRSQDGAAYSAYKEDGQAIAMITLARNALDLSGYLERPTLHTIRVMVLISAHYAMGSPGEEARRGVALLDIAATSCVQLDLHRDPDRRPNTLSFAEKEDRRRLYWTVFLHEALVANVLNRQFSLLRARNTDTRFPLDLRDEQLLEAAPVPTGEETVMTSLIVRMRFARLSDEITDELYGSKPITYDRILVLDRQVRELLPTTYRPTGPTPALAQAKSVMLQLGVMKERLRLHRPYLARSYFDDKYAFSRTMCIAIAQQTLKLRQCHIVYESWALIAAETIMAATILAVDLLYAPDGDPDGKKKQLIRATITRFEPFEAISTISRRGTTLLLFLLDKIEAPSRSFRPVANEAPLSKRLDTGTADVPPPVMPSPDPISLELPHKVPISSSGLSASDPDCEAEHTSPGSEAGRRVRPLPPSKARRAASPPLGPLSPTSSSLSDIPTAQNPLERPSTLHNDIGTSALATAEALPSPDFSFLFEAGEDSLPFDGRFGAGGISELGDFAEGGEHTCNIS